ncbi:MAG: hypothetical protein IJZ23_02015 [Roseburia sp.]|nr:hypothetical protein [Roseburia sp.]
MGGVTIGAGDASFLENFPYQFVIYYEVEGVEVIDEANSIYWVDGDVKIDITNKLEDGSASGIYEKDGCFHEYEVTEVLEGIWDVRISNKSAVKKVSLME